jgi:hypothetical protein
MWHSITPVTLGYDPIVMEGDKIISVLLFNAGPGTVEVRVWKYWPGNNNNDPYYRNNIDQPDYKLQIRAGNQRLISGSFTRLRIINTDQSSYPPTNESFAAVAWRIINVDSTRM